MIWIIIIAAVFISGFVTGIVVTILWDEWDRRDTVNRMRSQDEHKLPWREEERRIRDLGR